MRRLLSFFAIFTVLVIMMEVVSSAAEYMVVLKGGDRISCREPMKIQGQQAILRLTTGVLTSYPLALVDVVETERYNKGNLGAAYEIEELTVVGEVVPTPTPRTSLGGVASIGAGEAVRGPVAEPTVTPTPGIKLQDFDYSEDRVTKSFEKIFDDRGLYLYRTSIGTKADYFFVQAVTDNQDDVFKALRVVAEAYAVILKLDESMAPKAVELKMVATSGKPAGTFRLTPELAKSVANGTTPIPEFYVRHVIF